MTKNKRWHLYVLRLKDGKFYVGITSKTPEIRMQEHIDKKRSAYWTAMHEPEEIIYKKDLGVIEKAKAEKQENKVVRDLMKQRGVNNVRGGDLTSTDDYIKRLGLIRLKEDWDLIVYLSLTMIVLSCFVVDKVYTLFFS